MKHPGEDVTAEIVSAEPVLGRWRKEFLFQISEVGIKGPLMFEGREECRASGQQGEENNDDEREPGERICAEAAQDPSRGCFGNVGGS